MGPKEVIIKKLLLSAIYPISRREQLRFQTIRFQISTLSYRGGKVEIRKEHVKIYKIAYFQNSQNTFQVTFISTKWSYYESFHNLCLMIRSYL